MVKKDLTDLLHQGALRAQEKGLLPPATLPEITMDHPQNPEHGDYASSLPLKLARAMRLSPMAIAQALIEALPPAPCLGRVEAAPPGFINFTLKDEWLAEQVDSIVAAGESFGQVDLGKGERIQLEFVSVNPTGPLHVGHGRGAVLGSTLADVLTAAGYNVEREYYVNDAGSQMESFYRTLYARYRQCLGLSAEMPPAAYAGTYMTDLAREIIDKEGARFTDIPEDQAVSELGAIGLSRIIASLQADLELLGVSFDVWFSERSLYETSQFEKAMALLKERSYLEEKEDALWFTSTALGEDKDNVVIRSNGSPTYFASDIAYHYNKFIERQFPKVVNIWGADHMGHVSRMKAVVNALGIDPERLRFIICQMVSLKRGQETVKISKRTGEMITLRELIEEVGADACRFFFLSRSADSQMDFDMELAKKQSADNPVYYVQYAHARIASILRLAQERGIDFTEGDVSLLRHPAEMTLIRKMLLLTEMVEMAAQNLEPHHLPYYALDLATAFHSFYKQCRVVSRSPKDLPLTKARLRLVLSNKTVLANTLRLMGIAAPEQM